MMATIRKKIDVSAELTEEQLKMLKEAEGAEYECDKDNPILAKEELRKFRRKQKETKFNEK